MQVSYFNCNFLIVNATRDVDFVFIESKNPKYILKFNSINVIHVINSLFKILHLSMYNIQTRMHWYAVMLVQLLLSYPWIASYAIKKKAVFTNMIITICFLFLLPLLQHEKQLYSQSQNKYFFPNFFFFFF